jgi:hypothetical protein
MRPQTKRGYGQVCTRGLLEAQHGEIWPVGLPLSIFFFKGEVGCWICGGLSP